MHIHLLRHSQLILALLVLILGGNQLLAQPPGRGRGGGPPGGRSGGPPSGRGGFDSGGPGGGPMSFLSRLDTNGNGMLDPDEMEGRTRMMMERMAENANLDLSRPVPLSAIGRAFEEMRSRGFDRGGDSRSRDSDRGRGDDRGRSDDDRGRSRSSSSEPESEPLVLGFGEPDFFDPVPGFGSLGERFAVDVNDDDLKEAERTLSRNDGNKDGILDEEEIRRGRWGEDALLTDRNRDGKLTLNELALRYAIRRNERSSDSDRSRSSSRSSSRESSSSGSSRSSSSSDGRNRMVEMMFGRYDRDRNGTIEGEEMQAVRGGERYDTNRDGKITKSEFAESMAGRFGGDRDGGDDRSRFFSRRGDGGDSDNRDSRAEGAGSSGAWGGRQSFRPRSAAERLAALEDLPEWFARIDADMDGQVRMAEYASSWSDDVVADFGQFDLNEDGIITAKECLTAAENGAVQGTGAASGPAASGFGSRSSSREAASSQPASRQEAGDMANRYIRHAVGVIQKYDTDGDGSLNTEECKSMSGDYLWADTDKDGRITPAELAEAYQNPR